MCKNHFSPINCIIPPYITDRLAQSANDNVRGTAINTKFRSYRFRSDRLFFQNTSETERAILCAIPKKREVAVKPDIEVYDCKNSTNLSSAKLIWKNEADKKPEDQDAQNVIVAGDATWHFYYDIFTRNSVDNLGLTIKQ